MGSMAHSSKMKPSLPLGNASHRSRASQTEPSPSRADVSINPVWDVMPEVPVFCGRDEELEKPHSMGDGRSSPIN